MAYSAVPTVNTLDPWSAADHNTYIKDNLAYLKAEADKIPALTDPPKVRCVVTTNFNSTTSIGAISWETESFDTDTMFAAGDPTKITFTKAGLYLITLWVSWSSGTAGSYRHAGIYLSGSSSIGAITVPASDGAVVPVTCQALYQMGAGDYVTAKVQSGETEAVADAAIAAVRVSD